ncbi:MAG: hypothetical protein OEX21_00790 [Betaproteobacteria bacterium]|nr:hypothetical protein [Betaproteobacteria bacterium]
MVICPIAIVAGCKKCPAFSVCPLKTSLGDQPSPGEAAPEKAAASGKGRKKKSR